MVSEAYNKPSAAGLEAGPIIRATYKFVLSYTLNGLKYIINFIISTKKSNNFTSVVA